VDGVARVGAGDLLLASDVGAGRVGTAEVVLEDGVGPVGLDGGIAVVRPLRKPITVRPNQSWVKPINALS
jgi:hypothetical protein